MKNRSSLTSAANKINYMYLVHRTLTNCGPAAHHQQQRHISAVWHIETLIEIHKHTCKHFAQFRSSVAARNTPIWCNVLVSPRKKKKKKGVNVNFRETHTRFSRKTDTQKERFGRSRRENSTEINQADRYPLRHFFLSPPRPYIQTYAHKDPSADTTSRLVSVLQTHTSSGVTAQCKDTNTLWHALIYPQCLASPCHLVAVTDQSEAFRECLCAFKRQILKWGQANVQHTHVSLYVCSG